MTHCYNLTQEEKKKTTNYVSAKHRTSNDSLESSDSSILHTEKKKNLSVASEFSPKPNSRKSMDDFRSEVFNVSTCSKNKLAKKAKSTLSSIDSSEEEVTLKVDTKDKRPKVVISRKRIAVLILQRKVVVQKRRANRARQNQVQNLHALQHQT